jgi:hypothetical protein
MQDQIPVTLRWGIRRGASAAGLSFRQGPASVVRTISIGSSVKSAFRTTIPSLDTFQSLL